LAPGLVALGCVDVGAIAKAQIRGARD